MNSKLAILGGSPLLGDGPHYIWPLIGAATESAVLGQLHEDVAIYGRYGVFERFENAWGAYHGRRRNLLVNSGTNALYSMFVGCRLKAGDEVICPAYTFYATAAPLFHTGALPVLCESDSSGNIDPARVEELITSRTRAVVVTHMWGIPCRMDALREICDKHGLFLLEDASHAHGATYQGKLVGTVGDAAAWSLGGQKIVTGGEGGILSTDNEEIHSRAVMLGHYNKRCYGEMPADHPLRVYALTGMGLKFRASPMNTAMALEQFGHLGDWLAQKRIFAERITRRIAGLPGLLPPVVPDQAQPSWYSYVFQYDQDALSGLPIERFFEALSAEGCRELNRPTSTCPLNWLPLFQEPGGLFGSYGPGKRYSQGQFPVAERFAAGAITMPVWARPEDTAIVDGYLDAIEKVISGHKDLL